MTPNHPYLPCTEHHMFERAEHCAFVDPISQETCGEGPDAEVHKIPEAA